MSWSYRLDTNVIDPGGFRSDNPMISQADARRQARTAAELLQRLEDLPGQILADEVGMGKTYVALAVACAVALQDRRQVAVMVPSAVLEKWQRDFKRFCETCVAPGKRNRLTFDVAHNGVDFLKLLDDPPSRRKDVIFLAHGALSRSMSDNWVKLAMLQRAIKGRHGAGEYRYALGRFAGGLFYGMRNYERRSPELFGELVELHPSQWLTVLHRHGIEEIDDDPVPADLLEAMEAPELATHFEVIWEALQNLPFRSSKHLDYRLKCLRKRLNDAMPAIWARCFQTARIRLPLLILDEAHHVKNAGTRLASMFHSPEAEADAQEISRKGHLANRFERMLFLTATPFQLGHYELCNILERFEGVSWQGKHAPSIGLNNYRARIAQLREVLDDARLTALSFEQAWSRLRTDDQIADGERFRNVSDWWRAVSEGCQPTEPGLRAWRAYGEAYDRLHKAEDVLRHWVVRHTRPRSLQVDGDEIPRRRRLTGRAIDSDCFSGDEDLELEGLELTSDTALPFLLAARLVSLTPEKRPVSAEGLASSYDAFMDTRQNLLGGTTGPLIEDDAILDTGMDRNSIWYLDHIHAAIKQDGRVRSELHPKLRPVVDHVVELWRRQEKVLLFCHYIKTGRALRYYISERIRDELYARAAQKLSCKKDDVDHELGKVRARFEKSDSTLYRTARELVTDLVRDYPDLTSRLESIVDVVLRFLRTPTFLVRYFPSAGKNVTAENLPAAFERKDGSGLSFNDVIRNFLAFLEQRCVESQRDAYIDAVGNIQTGELYVRDDSEEDGDREGLLASVRLVNGSVDQETKQRLMLAFNTPFYPEVLVASSVLAEGVDLHLNCRHIIHHDLCWNPSSLEQRTGRVDRIGAKAEQAGRPIHVYYPYLAGTQDEKLYRVVSDRENWFSIVMGGQVRQDYETAERLAERLPLPEQIVMSLSLNLSLDL